MTPDFPAAHSMDTWWFAVDECGHVALFDSDEGGAVPVGALESSESLEGELRALLPRTQRLLVPPAHPQHLHPSQLDRDPVVVFAASRGDAESLLNLPGAREEGATRGHAVRLERLPEAVAEDLHERGTCDSCRSGYLERFDADLEELPARVVYHGIHFYSADLDHERPEGIYSHWAAPASPLLARDLPEPLRARMSAVAFPGCFTDHAEIHPPELLPSRGYDISVWYSLDGKRVGAFSGREGEYAHFIAREADALRAQGITWAPPTVPDPGPPPPRPAPPPRRPPSLLIRLLKRLLR